MDLGLQGKTALVLGGSKGLGRGVADALAAEGVAVALMARGQEAIDRAVAEINSSGARAVGFSADTGDWASVERAANGARAELGPIDILVNNSGGPPAARVIGIKPELWEAQFHAMVLVYFRLTDLLLPSMRERKWGRIINIASAHGLVASAEKAAYVTAKHGLVGLTKVIAIEAANDGVTCNAICPGWVLTPLVQAQIEARAKAQGIAAETARHDLLAEKQPMLDFTTPEKIAALAVFLCSEGASTMTGTALSIDGGWVAQ
jgi:3-hydroxybutyrate dehydrogenase